MTETLFGEAASAVLSDDGTYRYRLDRRWAEGPRCVFVMLNPSTADAEHDDPTIRRCLGFARREGMSALTVVNLFAYRATDPAELERCPVDVVGPENDRHIKAACLGAGPVILAWGAHRTATQLRVRQVLHVLRGCHWPPVCLGVTKSGAPRHPLYVRGDAPVVPIPAHLGEWEPVE